MGNELAWLDAIEWARSLLVSLSFNTIGLY